MYESGGNTAEGQYRLDKRKRNVSAFARRRASITYVAKRESQRPNAWLDQGYTRAAGYLARDWYSQTGIKLRRGNPRRGVGKKANFLEEAVERQVEARVKIDDTSLY